MPTTSPQGYERMHPESKRQLGEAIALILYFYLDAYALWPESHALALLAAVVGTAAVLLIELSWLRWAISTTALTILSLIVYFVIGPAKAPDTEITGLLQASRDPTPPNGCDHTPLGFPGLPPDTLRVLLGNNAVAHSGRGKFTALQVAQCPVLTMEKTGAGVSVFAEVYDVTGKLIARVTNNQLHVLTGEHVILKREGDLSALIVANDAGTELLRVRYLNETTIDVQGTFGCPGHTLVRVAPNEPVPGMFMSNVCLADSAVGIYIH